MSSQSNNHNSSTQPNNASHLRNYLSHYKTLSNPGYGVLITGEWGSGKTFQVDEIVTVDEKYYISLFGMQTPDEVYASVYAKMHPLKAKTKYAANATNGTEFGAFGFTLNLGGIVSGVANAFLRESVKTDRVLVFDDLERTSIETKTLLGIFNTYIEHHGCRVIVIAHDGKIADDLRDTKEKVFGQTIEVTPQISKAYDSFTSSLKEPETINTTKELKLEIINIFQQSSTSSLRILKYALEDLARLFKTLSPEHKSNKDAIQEICFLFLAFSFEVRSGKLKQSDLTNRYETIYKFQTKNAKAKGESVEPPIYEANSRYLNVDLSDQILKDETLINMLFKGNYIEREIQSSLNESLHFAKPEDLAPWLLFMKFDEISDNLSSAAAEVLKTQFISRDICIPGEMLHLFALRFLFSNMGLITADLDQTEIDCKEYINDLLEQDKLPANITEENSWADEFMQNYHGYGFWVESNYKQHFKNITDHLNTSQQLAGRKLLPNIRTELLNLVSFNGKQFAEKISQTFSGNNTYARIEILTAIEPIDFVQEWMGSQPEHWLHIRRGLENRYSTGLLSNVLENERKWLADVIREIDKVHKTEVRIRKKRIERIASKTLRNHAAGV